MIEQYSCSDNIDLAPKKQRSVMGRKPILPMSGFLHLKMCSRGERAMHPKIGQEILDDLIPSLEAVEAKSTAVLEFLKGEGIANEEKLAPYLDQAARASNVRWLGVRVRIERLLSAAEKNSAEKRTDKEEKKPETAQHKAGEASQSQPKAAANSKSAGPENPNENIGKNKNGETMRKDSDLKSNVAGNDSARNGNNSDLPETSEESKQAWSKR
jgi:uncharacterized protein YdaU (DUF1376 family)